MTGEMLWRPDGTAPSVFIQPCFTNIARGRAAPARVGPRNQARRLPADRPARRQAVRLFTRNGYDWTRRFSWIVEATHRLKVNSAIIDGEAVVCDENGMAISTSSIASRTMIR